LEFNVLSQHTFQYKYGYIRDNGRRARERDILVCDGDGEVL